MSDDNTVYAEDCNASIKTKVKVGKSASSKGWALNLEDINDFFPIRRYERDCHIWIKGILSECKIRINPRIFYTSEDLQRHIEDLDEGDFISLQLMYNKDDLDSKINEFFSFKEKYIDTQLTVGKSYKSKGWGLSKDVVAKLLPLDAYDLKFPIIVDGISDFGKINAQTRLFYNNEDLSSKLKELHDSNPKQKIDAKILLENANLTPYMEYSENKTFQDEARKCVICGKHLDIESKENKCSECLDKEVTVLRLKELLKVVSPGDEITVDDLRAKGIPRMRIRILTSKLLKYDLLTEELDGSFILKDENELNSFINKWDKEITINLKLDDEKNIIKDYNKGILIEELSEKYDVEEKVIESIISRFNDGEFDTFFLKEIHINQDSNIPKFKLAKSNNIPFNFTQLNPDRTLKFSNGHNSIFTIKDAISIHDTYYDGTYTIKELSKKFNYPTSLIRRIIGRFDEGDFDKFLDDPLAKESNYDTNSSVPKLKQTKYNDKPFKNLKLTPQKTFYINNNSISKYTIDDVVSIHDEYYQGASLKELSKEYNLSNITIERIICRYDEGDFDEVLRNIDSYIHKMEIPDYLNIPYDISELDSDKTFIYNSGRNSKFTLDDVVFIHKSYYKGYLKVKDLSDLFELNNNVIKRIIVRFDQGDFDRFLENGKLNDIKDNVVEKIVLSDSINIPYEILKLNDNNTFKYSTNHNSKFTLDDLIYIHDSYYEGYLTVNNLSKIFNFPQTTIKRIIGRFDEGDFDEYLKEPKVINVKADIIPKLKLPKNQNIPYDIKELNADRTFKYSSGHSSKFTIDDVIFIHAKYYEGSYSIEELSQKFDISINNIKRIITRFDARDFKKYVKKEINKKNKVKKNHKTKTKEN